MESSKLTERFFERADTHQIAKELLGKFLVRKFDDGRLRIGMIVETEAYHGFDDKASHASKSRTKRNEIMFAKGGVYYVYLIYGMYWNLNIITGSEDFPSGVLIRALEPVFDSEAQLSKLSYKERFALTSGPGKLCRWLEIDKSFYGKSATNDELFVSDMKTLPFTLRASEMSRENVQVSSSSNFEIVETTRIGIEYAGECSKKNWRYYIKDNPFISKK